MCVIAIDDGKLINVVQLDDVCTHFFVTRVALFDATATKQQTRLYGWIAG
jgi:hypothetical protein